MKVMIVGALDGHMLSKLFGQLFPERSSARYARFLGINTRSLQRFLDGEKVFDASGDQLQIFEDQKAALAASALPAKLQAAVEAADAAGLHPEVTAAWLAHAHKSVVDRAVE